MYLKIVFPPLLQQYVCACVRACVCVCARARACVCVNNSLAFGDEFLAQGLHLKSAGIRTWISADQSSSSTLTESSFLFDPCLIHRDTVMLE